MLLSLRNVVAVHPVDDSDGTVCAALKEHRPDWFVNGGDRTAANTPESGVCGELGIAMHFSGDPKISSSSVVMKRGISDRKWGRYELIYQGPTDRGWIKVKRLILNPGVSTSMQRHKFRDEFFFPISGRAKIALSKPGHYQEIASGSWIPCGRWHSIINEGDSQSSVLEVQVGSVTDEDDIERG